MLFNYDSFIIAGFVGTAIIVGGLFTYSAYNIFTTSATLNDSLLNTSAISIPSENTIPIPVPDPTPLPVIGPGHGYVDAAVQTDVTSVWGAIKNWFLEVFSIRSSEIDSIGINNVHKWINKLDPIQSVDLHDSESPLTSVSSNSTLRNLVNPDDSASNITEVVSESNLQDLVELTNSIPTHYNIVDFPTYSSIINTPDASFTHIIVEGVHQYFVIVGNAILSVDPSVFNYFV